jgi:heme-degrading monooxygenase HmoA
MWDGLPSNFSKEEYVYLWQFHVRPQYQRDFEMNYGPNGAWVTLFRQAPGYVSTLLLRDSKDPLRYVTVDRWQSRQTYEAFRQTFSDQYAAIDRRCEGFTESEEPLGEYDVGAA